MTSKRHFSVKILQNFTGQDLSLLTYYLYDHSGYGGSDGKAPAYNMGDRGSVSGLGRSEGNGTPLQHSCLENPMDRGAWWATVHGVTELDTAEGRHFHFVRKKVVTLLKKQKQFDILPQNKMSTEEGPG